MKINWNQPVLDYDGEIIEQPTKVNQATREVEEKKTFLVGDACEQALLAEDPQDKESPDDRFKRADLAQRIHNLTGKALERRAAKGIVPDDEFTSEEISTVKRAIKKFSHPITMHFVANFLDGKWKPEDEVAAEGGNDNAEGDTEAA